MKTQAEVREMRVILNAFGHPEAVKALDWVLDEYAPEVAMPAAPAATAAQGPERAIDIWTADGGGLAEALDRATRVTPQS